MPTSRPSSSAAARERRYDAIQRREAEPVSNPAISARAGSLCYDPSTGRLAGDPDSALHGLEVEIVDLYESTQTVLVQHVDLPDGELVLSLCPEPVAVAGEIRTTPEPAPPPQEPRCCVDTDQMVLVCEDPSHRLHGATVTEILTKHDDGLLSISLVDPADGMTKNGRLYPCAAPPPQSCCYDVGAGTLRCATDGGMDGLEVSLLAMQPQADGSVLALVMSDQLKPESTQTFPVCDDPVTDCCYDPTTETLVCPGTELDGTAAGIIAAWTGEDGQINVWAAWRGGSARMPMCPGTQECPPVFCCVNMQTMTYVCPGRPELNDQPATLADVTTDDGYTWGVLEDGTRVPLCGQQCPPPQLCPDCPTCPPGQWLSPDGVPQSPPHHEEPCCGSCAHGGTCESECDDRGFDGGIAGRPHVGVTNPTQSRRARGLFASGPRRNPYDRARPRKRRILSGN